MSKVIKSDEYIEAHPCRLDPIDVDAFFIHNDFSENKKMAEAASDEQPREETESSAEATVDLSRIADLAEKLGSIMGGAAEQAGAADAETHSEEARKFLDTAQQEAQRIFSGAKSQAQELTSKAGRQADQILNESKEEADRTLGEAKRQAELILEEARRQAELMTQTAKQTGYENDSLLENAQNKFRELSEGAKHQAGSILDGAKRQAGDITSGANRQAEEFLNDARQKADFAVEAASQKASRILEDSRQQVEDTLEKARQEAAALIESATKQSEQIHQTAAQEAVEIKKKAQQEGFAAGHEEGLAAVRKEFEAKLAAALSLLATAEQERYNRILSSEAELLKLAVEIAEKIIGAELQLNHAAQLEMVKAAISGIPTAGSIAIKINPDDYQLFQDNLPEIQKVFHDPIPLKLLQDQGVAVGNCYLETDHGNVDVRIKTQLEVIMSELLKMGGLE